MSSRASDSDATNVAVDQHLKAERRHPFDALAARALRIRRLRLIPAERRVAKSVRPPPSAVSCGMPATRRSTAAPRVSPPPLGGSSTSPLAKSLPASARPGTGWPAPLAAPNRRASGAPAVPLPTGLLSAIRSSRSGVGADGRRPSSTGAGASGLGTATSCEGTFRRGGVIRSGRFGGGGGAAGVSRRTTSIATGAVGGGPGSIATSEEAAVTPATCTASELINGHPSSRLPLTAMALPASRRWRFDSRPQREGRRAH
jgi:hypothetical protein